MAKYKASHTIQCWKQHRCAECSSLYRYLFKRQSSVTAASPEKAQALLRSTLEKTMATEIDERPCPQCGAYQPDMVAQHRRTRYARYGWCAVAVLMVSAVLSAGRALQIPVMTVGTIVVLGVFVALEARAALRNFNGDLLGNRQHAEKAVAKGELRLDAPGATGQPSDPGRGRPWPGFAALLALSVLVLVLAETGRLVSGWPLNMQFYPPVAGPGDSARFYLPESIVSIKNLWRGQPSAEIANAGELGLPTGKLPATASESTWNGTISAKSSEQSTSSSPWVGFTLPGDASLANKVAKLRLKLAAEFPRMEGASSYVTVRRDFTAGPDLRLAAPGAGETYQTLWYGSLAVSIILVALTSILLHRHARKEGGNTQTGLLPLEQANPPPMPGVG